MVVVPGTTIRWLDTENVRTFSKDYNIGVGKRTKVLRVMPNGYHYNTSDRPYAMSWDGCCNTPNCKPHMTFKYGIDYVIEPKNIPTHGI